MLRVHQARVATCPRVATQKLRSGSRCYRDALAPLKVRAVRMVRLQPSELIALAVKATESFKAVQQVKTLDAHAERQDRAASGGPHSRAFSCCSVETRVRAVRFPAVELALERSEPLHFPA